MTRDQVSHLTVFVLLSGWIIGYAINAGALLLWDGYRRRRRAARAGARS